MVCVCFSQELNFIYFFVRGWTILRMFFISHLQLLLYLIKSPFLFWYLHSHTSNTARVKRVQSQGIDGQSLLTQRHPTVLSHCTNLNPFLTIIPTFCPSTSYFNHWCFSVTLPVVSAVTSVLHVKSWHQLLKSHQRICLNLSATTPAAVISSPSVPALSLPGPPCCPRPPPPSSLLWPCWSTCPVALAPCSPWLWPLWLWPSPSWPSVPPTGVRERTRWSSPSACHPSKWRTVARTTASLTPQVQKINLKRAFCATLCCFYFFLHSTTLQLGSGKQKLVFNVYYSSVPLSKDCLFLIHPKPQKTQDARTFWAKGHSSQSSNEERAGNRHHSWLWCRLHLLYLTLLKPTKKTPLQKEMFKICHFLPFTHLF